MPTQLFLMLIIVGSFVPSLIAWLRRHHNALAIAVLNALVPIIGVGGPLAMAWQRQALLQAGDSLTVGVLFGMSGLVWYAALVWACTQPQRVYRAKKETP